MAQEKNDRIVCLFGSGISIPAGMPCTEQISRLLLPPRNFHRNSDGTFSFDTGHENPRIPRSVVPGRKECEGISKAIEFAIDRMGTVPRTAPSRELNYEDVIYVLHRLYERTPTEPLLYDVVDNLRRDLASHLGIEEYGLSDSLGKAIDCMTCLLGELLAPIRIRQTDHLAFLQEMVTEFGAGNVVIVTTNHDMLLEHYLATAGAGWTDGFPPNGDERNLWRPQILEANSDAISLLKIHGSINWFQIMPQELYNFGREYAKTDTDGSFPKIRNRMWRPSDPRPKMVIGTFDKPEEYLTGITGDLLCLFRRALRSTRNLVICGYGFRDWGVNKILDEWAFGELPRRMIVADPGPGAADPRPPAVEKSDWCYWWKYLTDANVARLVPKGLGLEKNSLTWEDLSSLLLRQT